MSAATADLCWSIAKQVPAIEPGQVWAGVMSNPRVTVVRVFMRDDFPYYPMVLVERQDGSRDTFGAAAFIGRELLTTT